MLVSVLISFKFLHHSYVLATQHLSSLNLVGIFIFFDVMIFEMSLNTPLAIAILPFISLSHLPLSVIK